MKKAVKPNLIKTLGNRETQVLQRLAIGKRTSEIAEELSIKANTVSTIKKTVFRKLNIKTSFELYKFATDNRSLISNSLK